MNRDIESARSDDITSDTTEISEDDQSVLHRQTRKTKSRPQIVASLVATLGTFCSGTVFAWTSTANPQLKNGKDIGTLTDSDLSLIASLAVVGALFSGFVAGFLIDKIGRRLPIIFLCIPFIFGWLLLAFAINLPMILVGRFITGFCAGGYTLIVSVYISEITQDKLRGPMGNFMVVSLVIGILFSYILGAFVHWKWLALASGIIPGVLAILAIFIPDSPRYLIEKGKIQSATQSLQWLRGVKTSFDVDEELKDLEQSVEEGRAFSATFSDLFTRRTMKPIGICLTLMAIQQFGGINAVIFFTVDIFRASGSDFDPNVASIIVGSVQVVFVIISTVLVTRVGRKILMFVSLTGMTISLTALGVFFYLKHSNGDKTPENLGWLPLLSVIAYIITYNLGCASLPWTYMGELCPSHIKGMASALVTSFCWGLAFVVTYTFADLRNLVGDHFVFWGFALFSACGALFSVFFLPETKNLTYGEIQKLF